MPIEVERNAGVWTITHAKGQGVTPGFQIKDALGVRYVIKFDLPEFPELCTSADVVGSHLLWAAGYNVPDDAIATFRVGVGTEPGGAVSTADSQRPVSM